MHSFWMQRKCQHRFAARGLPGRERHKRNSEIGRKRIRTGAKNGDVVLRIGSDYAHFDEARRSVGTVHQDVRLAPVVKCLQNVRDREQVALLVDEERVAEEGVLVAAIPRGFVVVVHNGSERRARGVIGSGTGSVRWDYGMD